MAQKGVLMISRRKRRSKRRRWLRFCCHFCFPPPPPPSKWLPLSRLLLLLLLKVGITLSAIGCLLSLCRWATPELGHRAAYFGTTTLADDDVEESTLQEVSVEENSPKEAIGEGERDEAKLNGRRVRMAQRMLLNWARQQKQQIMRSNGTEMPIKTHWLAIGIVASARPNQELTQVVGHLFGFWLNNSSYGMSLPNVVVCNTEPEGHRPLELQILVTAVGGEQMLGVIDLNATTHSNNWPQKIAKESADYWHCLGTMARTFPDAKYILLLEDDALPIAEFPLAVASLARLLDRRPQEEIDYVKLYHPWAYRGIPALIQSAVLSIAAGFGAQQLWAFLLSAGNQPSSQWQNYSLIGLTAIGSHLMIRSHFYQLFAELHFHLSGGQPLLTSPESCCTPAVLFRRQQAQAMASELGQSLLLAGPDHAKDHILDESRFRGRQTDLNLVVHIGWFSVLRQRTVPTGELF